NLVMGWRYKTGLFLILTVVITWVTCAEVTQLQSFYLVYIGLQGIFEDYEHPFALAYLGTSLLVLFLPIAFIKDGLFHLFRRQSHSGDKIAQITNMPSGRVESPVKVDGVPELDCKGSGKEDGTELKSQEEGIAIDIDDVDKLKRDKSALNNKEMARLGFLIAPVWFITEYLTNAALARTSVSSTMVLNSTSGLFTLFIGAFLGQDSINMVKVVSVVVSLAGVAMTALGKTWSTDQAHLRKSTNGKHSLVGDLCALLSAMTYALFCGSASLLLFKSFFKVMFGSRSYS
ncbi:hypothetical protein C3L33_03724, partial [Rhododendron williamsianum]